MSLKNNMQGINFTCHHLLTKQIKGEGTWKRKKNCDHPPYPLEHIWGENDTPAVKPLLGSKTGLANEGLVVFLTVLTSYFFHSAPFDSFSCRITLFATPRLLNTE